MQYTFFSAAAAFLALSSSVQAQTNGFDPITSPTKDQSVAAGSSLDIIWEPGTQTGSVTISLLEGADPTTLAPGPVIQAGIDNTLGKYTWAIPNNVGTFATYGFQITNDTDSSMFQYSFPFHITGGQAAPTTSGSTTTTVSIATGPSFTSSSSSTSSTAVSTTSSTSTVATVTATATTSVSSSSASSNSSTLMTSAQSTTTSASKTSSKASSSTSSAASSASSNAAAGNVGTSGLALVGGILMAMAL